MSNFNYNPSVYESSDNEHIYYNLSIDNAFNGVNNATTRDCVYDKQSPNIIQKQVIMN